MKELNISSRLASAEDDALTILSRTFSYPRKIELLSKSFLDLGLQSMEFVKFTDQFSKTTGMVIPPSSYTSHTSLKDIITSILM